MYLGSGCYKGASGRTQIHPIRRIWQFHGEVWIYLLSETGFFALIPRMTTSWLFCLLVGFGTGIFYRCLCVWGMCTICTSFQTAWEQWLWWLLWSRQGCLWWQYPGDNISGWRFYVELWCCLWWETGVENIGEELIWDIEIPWDRVCCDFIGSFDVLGV